MKFPFYTNLHDSSSASNCRDISKQKARTLSAPQSFKASKKPSQPSKIRVEKRIQLN